MLLQLIFITFVVCTAKISEFHASFLCFFAHFGNFSLVSCGACDKFSFSSVVNSGDIGKNARLAKNGSVQQTSVIQPEVVEHRPVFSGLGAGLIPGTRYPGPGAPSPAW